MRLKQAAVKPYTQRMTTKHDALCGTKRLPKFRVLPPNRCGLKIAQTGVLASLLCAVAIRKLTRCMHKWEEYE